MYCLGKKYSHESWRKDHIKAEEALLEHRIIEINEYVRSRS